MATKYGTYSSDRLEDVPSTKIPADVQHGRIRIAYDEYTFTADLAAADVIHMGLLPKGARVVGYWLKADDLDASGGTLDLGWAASSETSGGSAVEAADDDGFLSNVDVTSAITIGHQDQENMTGLGKKFSAEVAIQVKIEGDTDVTSGTLKTCVFYVVD